MATESQVVLEGQVDPAGMVKPAPRLDSVDFLRGLVMVLMVLDHTRDYFADTSFDPTDLSKTYPALFMTRWVTHFCAPVFAFLAGTGASLAGARGMARADLARFLVTRGLWLIVLEQTVEKFGLAFRPSPTPLLGFVLWSIGGSMVLLSGLVALGFRARTIGILGVLIVAGNDLLDGLNPADAGILQPLAVLFVRRGVIGTPSVLLGIVGYPLLPWFGVVAAGFGFGEVYRLEPARRRKVILGLGLALTATFLALRAANGYGDPSPWRPQPSPLLTLLSFINCTKYTPSLLFLLMTLGPALVVLALADRGVGAVGRPFITLGRVPLFYYLLQWYVIHTLAILVAALRGQPIGWLFVDPPSPVPTPPPGSAYGLPVVYLMWAVVIAVMYGPCLWFASYKKRHRDVWWLGYF